MKKHFFRRFVVQFIVLYTIFYMKISVIHGKYPSSFGIIVLHNNKIEIGKIKKVMQKTSSQK